MKTHLSPATLASALLVLPAFAFAGATALPDQSAVAITKVAPEYPTERILHSVAHQRPVIEGKVVVSFVISAKGEVWNALVVSSTNRELDQPVLSAIKQWTFTPAVRDGQVAAIRALQEFEFRLADQSAASRTATAGGKR